MYFRNYFSAAPSGAAVFVLSLANSTKMRYTYDSLSRVTSRAVKDLSDNSVISAETFTYDAAGNITQASDGGFVYDTNNRLTGFNGNPVSLIDPFGLASMSQQSISEADFNPMDDYDWSRQ